METSSVHASAALEPGTWRCLACTKPSNTIQVLPCQHKFCAPCLKLWAMIYIDMYNGGHDEFPCQVCWKRYAVPAQGLEAFEQDFQVRLLQETMAQMTMGRKQPEGIDLYRGQTPPFSYTPDNAHNIDMNSRVHDEMSDYMQQPYTAHNPSVIPSNMTEQSTQMEDTTSCDAPTNPSTIYPSMVTHMVPQPLTGTQEYREESRKHPGPGYCMRSQHMYMHMV